MAAIFALGFFVTIIQVIRIFSVKNLQTYTDSKNLILWSIVEVSLGVSRFVVPFFTPLGLTQAVVDYLVCPDVRRALPGLFDRHLQPQ